MKKLLIHDWRYYYALIPLSKDTDLKTPALASRLAARLTDYQVSYEENEVTVRRGDWSLSLWLSNEEWINIEAKEMADMHPDWPNVDELRESFQRLELASYCNDFDMNHFNTYLFVLEEIDTFNGVLFKFDPRDGCLI